MIFGFSLYTVFLLAIIVAYFGTRLENLADKKPLEDGKICCITNLSIES